MALPTHRAVQDALLSFVFRNGGPTVSLSPGEVYGPLADVFGLTVAERAAPRHDRPNEREWDNRVQWARRKLVDAGLFRSGVKGVWALTDRGRTAAGKK